ncbi:hypothetical protein ABGF48_00800 [Helcococcus bovis]|uniref:hypothetical protein n=1 Tax=Helcococcus bovis TaxID=3153252 RepID=UPI0038B7E48D
MENILLIVSVAILIEALVTYIKEIVKTPVLLGTVAIGIVIAFLFNATLFTTLGMQVNKIADIILTGIVASRGSNYLYDLVGKLTKPQINN